LLSVTKKILIFVVRAAPVLGSLVVGLVRACAYSKSAMVKKNPIILKLLTTATTTKTTTTTITAAARTTPTSASNNARL